jgi:hypothetical protein
LQQPPTIFVPGGTDIHASSGRIGGPASIERRSGIVRL